MTTLLMIWIAAAIAALLVAVAIYDLTQRRHAILRTFPVIGHVRYWLEALGPELRQYIVTDNNEERPFSRDQRRWISPEIAEIRGVPRDRDCISPAGHSEFGNADQMLDFVESIASETGLPVGI
jgi:glutamate synthase domain-containing protein 2